VFASLALLLAGTTVVVLEPATWGLEAMTVLGLGWAGLVAAAGMRWWQRRALTEADGLELLTALRREVRGRWRATHFGLFVLGWNTVGLLALCADGALSGPVRALGASTAVALGLTGAWVLTVHRPRVRRELAQLESP
jgi:hypothetical protein